MDCFGFIFIIDLHFENILQNDFENSKEKCCGVSFKKSENQKINLIKTTCVRNTGLGAHEVLLIGESDEQPLERKITKS